MPTKKDMVFLRAKKFKRKNETERTYFYIVEAKRENGKVKQKVIQYLGTAETILKDYKELAQLRKKKD